IDPDDVSASVFLNDLDPELVQDSQLLDLVDRTQQSRKASEAIRSGNSLMLSHLVGITEQDLDGSALRLPLRLDDVMTNNDATAFIGGAGNPNTGKTNLMALLAELRSATVDDLLVISNSRTWPRTDLVVTSAHDLAVTCIEHRDRPKFVFIDEGSTHFDARTNSYEVAAQFSPLAKRMAKINVDVFGTVFHTGKDCHPELKRLFTTAYFKHSKKEVDFFADWPADADKPTNQLFGGTVENPRPRNRTLTTPLRGTGTSNRTSSHSTSTGPISSTSCATADQQPNTVNYPSTHPPLSVGGSLRDPSLWGVALSYQTYFYKPNTGDSK
ncbi:hypothetical protein, partial [Halorubrum sp. SP9]|uniref:hypothetical protein n=1 Tax=Halorubrum sp. SP9 TaxID=1537267 RepID=UPI001F5412A5